MTSRTARQRHGPLAAVPLLATLALAGCLHDNDSPRGSVGREPGAPARSGEVTITRGRAQTVPYVAGDRAYGLLERGGPVRLGTAVDSTLVATLSPAGLLDPSRRMLAYNTWAGGGPAVRLHELATGRDRVLDAGAFSLAWRGDGALAYVKGLRARLDPRRERPRGHVVVRADVEAPPVRWTDRPRHYVVAAWARDRLLAYRIPGAKRRWPDLIAFDGPGRARLLARRSGLVAVSPDGTRALITQYGASPALVRVLNVARGAEEARLRLGERAGAEPLQWVTESGSWTGPLVAAKAEPGLAIFRLGVSEIKLDQVLHVDRAAYPLGVFEPHIDGHANRIFAWGQRAQQPRAPLPTATVLSCDRLKLRCVEGANVAAAAELRLVVDPSRP